LRLSCSVVPTVIWVCAGVMASVVVSIVPLALGEVPAIAATVGGNA
jgi:hypothetical protein